MNQALWIAKTGLEAQQTQMDVISNNLANVSTNGFKRSRAVFEDLLYQNLRQPGAQSSQQTEVPSGLQIGTGVQPVSTERISLSAGERSMYLPRRQSPASPSTTQGGTRDDLPHLRSSVGGLSKLPSQTGVLSG